MQLSAPQNIFLNGLDTKFRAYVGGFGSGKTFVGCLDLLIFFGQNPGTRQGYFGPSYPSIRDIFFPTFEEAAHLMGFTCDIRESNKEVHVRRNGRYYGTVICRSMDRPSTIIGFKISRALVDEIDTLPKAKAKQAWNKIIARLRLKIDGVENGIGVTTTPEGFMFVYEQFALNPTERYSMVQASTYENERYLPEDYIDSLIETYPEGLISAYLDGQFVNLTAGTVYRSYDRKSNDSSESIQPGEPLLIGMDFNKGKMAACVFVKRDQAYHCVDEVKEGLDTPWMADLIHERWQRKGHKITIYPDASGQNASSKGASVSDIAILKQKGFSIRAKSTNPRVRDRINSVNKCFETASVFINSARCPETARCIEQQAYDSNGEPDKKSGLDHQVDAFGYFCAYEFPIVKPVANVGPIRFL